MTPYYYSPAPAAQLPPEPPAPPPPARYTPYIWMGSLIVLTMVAVLLSLLAPRVIPAAPGTGGTPVYSNSLAQDDGAWTLTSDNTGMCSYANGGLDATTSQFDDGNVGSLQVTIDPPTQLCTLKNQNLGDLRLGVTILPAGALNHALQPAIFIHSDVALIFGTNGQLFVVDRSGSTDWKQVPDLSILTDEWHSADALSNRVEVQVIGSTYTIGLNGAQIYQGDFNGAAENLTQQGFVALGAYTSSQADIGEAAFSDFALSTP
jgi:hypothetical protein